jgi:hypothetical protein
MSSDMLLFLLLFLVFCTYVLRVFCRPDQCSLTNSYVDDNSCLISE